MYYMIEPFHDSNEVPMPPSPTNQPLVVMADSDIRVSNVLNNYCIDNIFLNNTSVRA
jgi:hypothetical protein